MIGSSRSQKDFNHYYSLHFTFACFVQKVPFIKKNQKEILKRHSGRAEIGSYSQTYYNKLTESQT